MASVEYAVPRKRNPLASFVDDYGAALAVGGCVAFWGAVVIAVLVVI
jgi:hypothetical protein